MAVNHLCRLHVTSVLHNLPKKTIDALKQPRKGLNDIFKNGDAKYNAKGEEHDNEGRKKIM